MSYESDLAAIGRTADQEVAGLKNTLGSERDLSASRQAEILRLNGVIEGLKARIAELEGQQPPVDPPPPPVNSRWIPKMPTTKLPFNLCYFGPNQAAAMQWLGLGTLDGTMSFTWRYDWANILGMLDYAKNNEFKAMWNGLKIVTTPTGPYRDNVTESTQRAAEGGNDSYFRQFAEKLKSLGYDDGKTVIRLNHEFNGDWYAFRLNNPNPATFVAAWRRFVDVVRPICPSIRYNWCPSRQATHSGLWTNGYPGDDYVDIIGIDSYDSWPGVSSESYWNSGHLGPGGTPKMMDVINLATSKNKQWAVDEWGVVNKIEAGANNVRDNALFVEKMINLFSQYRSNLAYVTWYNDPGSPADLQHQLYPTTTNPNASAKFKSMLNALKTA